MIRPQNGLIGFASCVVDGRIFIGNIGIRVRPGGGYRLLYPDKQLPTGLRSQTVFPITKAAGQALERAVTREIETLAAVPREGVKKELQENVRCTD